MIPLLELCAQAHDMAQISISSSLHQCHFLRLGLQSRESSRVHRVTRVGSACDQQSHVTPSRHPFGRQELLLALYSPTLMPAFACRASRGCVPRGTVHQHRCEGVAWHQNPECSHTQCLFYGSMPREDADPQVDPLCSHHLWREGALGGASVGQGAAFTTLCAVDGAATRRAYRSDRIIPPRTHQTNSTLDPLVPGLLFRSCCL